MNRVMRCILFFELLLSSFTFASSTTEYSWHKVPYPRSEDADTTPLYSIHAFDGQTAIAAGANGMIARINDNQIVRTPKAAGDDTLRWITFSDSEHGWVAGDNGAVYRSINKGVTWSSPFDSSTAVSTDLKAVAAPTEDCAWIAGDSGTILRTSDGGTGWIHQDNFLFGDTSISQFLNNIDFISVSFSNCEHGCILGNMRTEEGQTTCLFITCNGGDSWTGVNYTRDLAPVEVCIIGKNIYLFHREVKVSPVNPQPATLDCLQFDSIIPVRIEQNLSLPPEPLHSMWRICSFTGSFHYLNTFDIIPGKSFHMDIPDTGTAWITNDKGLVDIWIAGDKGLVYHSPNTGQSWLLTAERDELPVDDLQAIFFSDPAHGWISGNNGTLLYTNDSGDTWQPADIPFDAAKSFRHIHFNDNLNGCIPTVSNAVGSSSGTMSLAVTVDGGTNWTTLPLPFSPYSYNFFSGDQTLLIFSEWDASFFISTGDSINWVRQSPLSNWISFTDCHIFSADTFWLSGMYSDEFGRIEGKIIRTTDGGNTIMQIPSVTRTVSAHKSFNSITFSDISTGWVVGDDGIILKSIDGGINWELQPPPVEYTLDRIRFFDQQTGWILFNNNRVLFTNDNGATWQDQSFFADITWNDFACADRENYWAVGDGGLILHLRNNMDRVVITNPAEDMKFCIGDSMHVEWSGNAFDTVSIAISYNGGESFTTYLASTENDGSETLFISSNALISDQCILRIRDRTGTSEVTSGMFSITPPDTTALLFSPVHSSVIRFALSQISSGILLHLAKRARISLSVYSPRGMRLYHTRMTQPQGCHEIHVPVNALADGCYLLQMSISGRNYSRKFIIHR